MRFASFFEFSTFCAGLGTSALGKRAVKALVEGSPGHVSQTPLSLQPALAFCWAKLVAFYLETHSTFHGYF